MVSQKTFEEKGDYRLLSKNMDYYNFLETLALDLRSSWNHSADAIWRQLDLELWQLTHNPWAVLQTTSKEKIKTVLAAAR